MGSCLSGARMARYKRIATSPRFIAVDLERQLLPGPFEHALNYLVDHELGGHAPVRRRGRTHPPRHAKSRRWRDGAWESLINEMQMAQEILHHFYGLSVMKIGSSTASTETALYPFSVWRSAWLPITCINLNAYNGSVAKPADCSPCANRAGSRAPSTVA